MKRFLKYDTEITKKENSPVDKNGLIKENIVGGGSSVQPDWNQNDSTQPDYVKNRPFYTGDPVETVLVEESTVSFANQGGRYIAEFPSTFSATVGETYKVSWDGAAYECTCVNFNGYTAIGNLSIAGAGSDTGEPFAMSILNGEGIYIGTADTSASHTFSISRFVPEVVKIDGKYLPDTIAAKSDVESARSTANAAKTAAENAQTAAENAQTAAENAQIAADNAVGADVVKGNYKLRIGEKKNAGYGFAILYNDSVLMNYTDSGIYDEKSGSILQMSSKSVFKSPQASKKKIEITTNPDTTSSENSITLYGSNGLYISISADGSLYYNGKALKIGNVGSRKIVRYVNTPEEEYDAATKGYVDGKISDTEIFLQSSTTGSTKQFKITVDDSGAITATEVS